MPLRKRHLALLLLSLLSTTALTACGNPEEREARYLKRGNELFDQGEYEKARVEYKNAARLKPTASEPRYRLGLVEEAEGNIKTAFADFIKAEEQDAHYHPALLKLASYYVLANQLDKAQQKLDVVLSDTPDDAEAHALHAAILLRQNNPANAEKEARAALAKDPADATAYLVLTGLYIDQGDNAKAEATIEDGLTHDPKNISLLIMKARVYEQAQNLPKIVEAYKAMFELKPQEKRYRVSLAQIYAKMGKTDEAEATLRAGIAAMPDDDEMEHQLVVFLSEQRSIDAAEKEVHGYIAAHPDKDQLYLWLVDLYIHHNAVDRAVTLLNQIIGKHGSDSEGLAAQTALAHIDYLKGDKKTAGDLVGTVLAKDPNNLEALFIRAQMSFDQGQYENAISDLRAIIRTQPKSKPALQLLSEVFVQQGHLDLAIDTLNQLVDVDPENTTARVRLAQLYHMNGDSKRAMDILFLVTKEKPKDPMGWEVTARTAIAVKDWPTAQKAIDTLDILEGQHLLASFLHGQLLAASGKPADAIPYFKQVVDANSSTLLAQVSLAALVEASHATGKMEDATHYIESLKSNDPIVNTLLGECYVNLGKTDQAAAAFDTAIAAGPSRPEPYLDRAKLYLHDHKDDQAVAVLKKGALAAPADARAPMMEAEILGDQGQYESAIALYEDLLSRNPGLDAAANNLAEIIADYKYTDPVALEKARQAAERFAALSNPFLLDTLGWVYYRMGNLQQAQTVMEKVMKADAKLPPQIHYHYGMLLLKTGDKQRAKEELQQAVIVGASYPGLDEARKSLASL